MHRGKSPPSRENGSTVTDARSTVSRGARPLCSPIRSYYIWFQRLIISLDCSQISCSLRVYPSPGSSENSARISSLMGQMRVRRTGPWVKISCPFSWVQFNSVRGSRRGSMSIILAVHHKHPLYFHNIRSNSQLQLPKMLQRLFASHAHPHRNVGYEADILFPACHQSCQRS